VKSDYQVAALGSRQGGLLGRQQAIDLGLSEAAIRHRVESGVWTSIHKGLYRVTGMSGGFREALTAAMAILPDPTISHESAAEIHQIPYVVRSKAVVTVHSRTTHDFPGVTVHRSLDLIEHHRRRIGDYMTTTVPRTLVDLAATMHRKALANALDEELASGRTDIEEIHQVFKEVARPGRTGSKLMRGLLAERLNDELVTASRLEKVGMSVFEAVGLPRPNWQYPAPWDPTNRIDFAWPHVCVGCECDSKRCHSRLADFQTDRNRDNLALFHNWRIFRFTWKDFTTRPDFLVAQLRAAIG
jgi:hypothetical protein